MTISCLAQISKWLEKEGLCFLLFSHTLGLNASTYLKVSISRSAPSSRKKIKVAPNKGSDWFAVCFSGLHANSKFSTFFFLNIVWFPSVRKLLSALKNFSHLQHIMSLWQLHSTTQLSKKNQVERPLVDCSISCSVMGCSQMNSTSLGMSLFCLFYIHVPPVLHRGLLRGWDTDNKICKSKCPLFSSWTWKCQPPYLGS